MAEAKQAQSFDEKYDETLETLEKETPADTSSVKKPEGEPETSKPAGAEPDKTAQVKEVDEDKSLSADEKIAKIKEILGDDEEALDAYIKSKGYHKDPAWIKQREIIDRLKKEKTALSEDDKRLLQEVKDLTSSPEYIQLSMQKKGYTQEAIDGELRKRGFDVPARKGDDVELIINKLGVDPKSIDENTRALIGDVAKIANILFEDRFGKVLPSQLKPIQENLDKLTADKMGTELASQMKEMAEAKGILKFKEDVEPLINKFLDDNPEANADDVLDYCKDRIYELTVDRLQKKGKKEERIQKEEVLRPTKDTIRVDTSKLKRGIENIDENLDALGL